VKELQSLGLSVVPQGARVAADDVTSGAVPADDATIVAQPSDPAAAMQGDNPTEEKEEEKTETEAKELEEAMGVETLAENAEIGENTNSQEQTEE
jgi:hypothetical protein